VDKSEGRYVTVGSNEEFKKFIEEVSMPPEIRDESVQSAIFKVGLCRKEYNEKGVECFCHFERVVSYYVCGFCNGISCKTPPIECSVCKKLMIVPSDLSRHRLTDYKLQSGV
jgi:hypothetical protein